MQRRVCVGISDEPGSGVERRLQEEAQSQVLCRLATRRIVVKTVFFKTGVTRCAEMPEEKEKEELLLDRSNALCKSA